MRFAAIVLLILLAPAGGVLAGFDGLLHYARTRNLDGVRDLLEQGADPNPPYESYDGYTPLMFAAGYGLPDMTRLLLEAGAETERRDHNGDRALQWAARKSYMNHFTDTAEAARLLLEAGSPPDSDGDRYGSSPLIDVNAFGSDPVMTRHLIAAGADVNRRDNSGRSPLFTASGSAQGHEAVRLLLEAGAEPDIRVDHLDRTPLHRAAGSAGPQTIRLLIEAGAAVEARNNDGATALFVAAARGRAANVEALVSLGAQVDAPAADGLTPILAAVTGRTYDQSGHAEAALHLAGVSDDIDRAFAAALWAHMPQVAERLLQRGADVGAVDHAGRSVLAGATALSATDWFERLVAHGADLARHGGEALGVAAAGGADDLVRRLLGLGVGVDARAPSGATALLFAARSGRVSTVRLLLQQGADPRARDAGARRAFDHMAQARDALEAVIAHAEASRAYINVSAERVELARLQAAHAEIGVLLGS